jgi:hypothetical protein
MDACDYSPWKSPINKLNAFEEFFRISNGLLGKFIEPFF